MEGDEAYEEEEDREGKVEESVPKMRAPTLPTNDTKRQAMTPSDRQGAEMEKENDD